MFVLKSRFDAEKNRAIKSGRLATELMTERDAARAALADIMALETPSCAHIGKKMATRAREALTAG